LTGWARRRLAHALDRRFEALHHRVDRVASRVEEVASRADQLAAVTAELRGVVDAVAARLHEEISPALRLMAGSDAESRRLLEAARRDPEYELAFEEGEPLVTAILPTHGRADLRSRSLPPSSRSRTSDSRCSSSATAPTRTPRRSWRRSAIRARNGSH
jgi:hypothetical protein